MKSLPQDLVRALDRYFSYKRIRQGYKISSNLWHFFIPDNQIPVWGVRSESGEIQRFTKEDFELGATYIGTRLAWNYTIRREFNGLYVQCLTIPVGVKIVLVDPETGGRID